MNVVVIRADSSTLIGGGHIYRCLTLADTLKGNGYQVHFICQEAPGHLCNLIEQQGFGLNLLPPAEPINERRDALLCREIIESFVEPVSFIIVDHYRLAARWHRQLAPLCPSIAVIDDLANRVLDCDLIFDQSSGRQEHEYALLEGSDCQTVLTGAELALLRPQFAELREDARKKRNETEHIHTVLVALSATDPDNITEQVLLLLSLYTPARNWHIHVVLTDGAGHLDSVRQHIEQSALDISLHVNVKDMAKLILASDIAIAAAGTSMLERCCLGLPSLIVVLADNQQHIANHIKQSGNVIAVLDREALPTVMLKTLDEFIDNPARYGRVVNKAFATCDGSGVNVLCRELHSLEPRQHLKKVTQAHRQLLFDWQQDTRTREFSRDPEPPTWEQHVDWFARTVGNPDIHFYLIIKQNQPCGYVRIHPKTEQDIEGFEVSIALAPGSHGRGIGHQALMTLGQLHAEKDLLAYIEPQNTASIKAFTRSGYLAIEDNWYHATRTPHEH